MIITAGTVIDGHAADKLYPKKSDGTSEDRASGQPSISNQEEISYMPPFASNSWIKVRGKEQLLSKPSNASDVISSGDVVKISNPVKLIPPVGHIDQQLISPLDPRANASGNVFTESQLFQSASEFSFGVEDLNIPWSDLVLKERIGAGTFCCLPVPNFIDLFGQLYGVENTLNIWVDS